jgi:hypothetical protein
MAPTHRLPRSLAGLSFLLAAAVGVMAAAAAPRPLSAPGIAAAKDAPTPPMSDAEFTFQLYSALRRTTTPQAFAELTSQALSFDFARYCLMPREEERLLPKFAGARLAGNQQRATQLLQDCHVRVFAGERGGRTRYVVLYVSPKLREDRSALFREATGDDVIIGTFGGGDAKAAGYAHHIF